MAHARRPHAGGGELVVEPGRRPAAEIRADGMVNRREHLQEHEHDADQHQRNTRSSPRWTAPTSTTHGDGGQPPAESRAAGARSTRRWPGCGRPCGRTPKNFHSLRATETFEHQSSLLSAPIGQRAAGFGSSAVLAGHAWWTPRFCICVFLEHPYSRLWSPESRAPTRPPPFLGSFGYPAGRSFASRPARA